MIREQADALLAQSGLMELLNAYGTACVTGSYSMDMMCWNDLDLYIEDSPQLRRNWFALVGDVLGALQPCRFDGICRGGELFLGCETMRTGERWNVDLWVRSRAQIESAAEYCGAILRRTEREPELKEAIMEIKRALIAQKLYGMEKRADRHYHSGEIYRAVLEEGIRTPEEFLEKHAL
ncbi:MAG: hypothetical protein Q4A66_01560 [Eubacteriales bacterium]|nr:hypothetical protein [Eubacteriales bacterium]